MEIIIKTGNAIDTARQQARHRQYHEKIEKMKDKFGKDVVHTRQEIKAEEMMGNAFLKSDSAYERVIGAIAVIRARFAHSLLNNTISADWWRHPSYKNFCRMFINKNLLHLDDEALRLLEESVEQNYDIAFKVETCAECGYSYVSADEVKRLKELAVQLKSKETDSE